MIPDTPSFTVRLATVDDAQELSRVSSTSYGKAFRRHFRSDQGLHQYMIDNHGPVVTARNIENEAKSVFVATNSSTDAILGMAMLSCDETHPSIDKLEKAANFHRLYVDHAYHGIGIGRALSSAVEDRMRKDGYSYSWLSVAEDNPRAKEFYAAMGYRYIGDHPHFNEPNGMALMDHIWYKEL